MSLLQEKIYFTDGKKDKEKKKEKPKKAKKKRAEISDAVDREPLVSGEQSVIKRYLKSSTGLSDDELFFLTRHDINLLDAKLSIEQDHYILEFDLADTRPLDSVDNMMTYEKYTVLYNAGNLQGLAGEYSFSMEPSNLYLTSGLGVRILERQIKTPEDSFLSKYKAFIGSILQPAYTYQDYLNGGKDLFDQDDLLKQISVAETTDAIQSLLSKSRDVEIEKNFSRYEYVDRKRVKLLKRLVPILAVFMLAGFAVAGYSFFIKGAMDGTIIEANNQYIRGDYGKVMEAIKDADLEKLPQETKYVAAQSAVLNENISEEQKKNILKAMNVNTNDKVFDFWICIGRDEPSEALEVAKSLNSLELQYYAIASYIRKVEKDANMSGSKKEKLLGELNQQREEWEKELNEAYDKQTEEDQAAAEAAMEKVQEENDNDENEK